ncbi:MAG: alpha/beta hydrolase [Pirellulales bacterium]|nr:alpha/beta hydrolase [Pirellulales bacterium]
MRTSTAVLFVLILGATALAAAPDRPVPTHADVAYGPHARQVLDFWKAEGKGPRPLLVYIHGGGWYQGDKNDRHAPDYHHFLKKGISCAAVNYRLSPKTPLPAPVHDAARAVQFLRFKAREWNIDASRIALTGGSAGACTSMWILLHDDLADPKSKDPVLRESTRVTAAAVLNGQTSIDPKVMEPWLGREAAKHPMIFRAVGEKSLEDVLARYTRHRPLFVEFSPYNHLDRADPPLYMYYDQSMDLPSKDIHHGIHHPVYGVKLKEKADRLGHECHLEIKGVVKPKEYANLNEFLMKKLLTPKPRSMNAVPSPK